MKVVSKDENENFLYLTVDFIISLPNHFFQIVDLIREVYCYKENSLGLAGVCLLGAGVQSDFEFRKHERYFTLA